MIHFHVITLFPEAFESYLKSSIVGRAIKQKKVKISFYNPRDFSKDKHRRVDRKPYGGGPGMVLEVEPIVRAATKAVGRKKKAQKIFFSPSGKEFNTKYANRLATLKDVLLIAGHYEGVDARVTKILKTEEVSVGPYVLTGGELPAMTVIDAVARQIPGVLGKEQSLEDKRTSSSEVYTRPEVFEWKGKKYRVPKVLLSGHHAEIDRWKRRD